MRSASILRLPVVHKRHAFVEPTKGEHKWCEQCGRTALLHPKFADTWCSECGESMGPGDHGYSSCAEHSK